MGKLSANPKESSRIGNCLPFTMPCNSNEEAPQICGNYFKCCVPRNDTVSLARGLGEQEIKKEEYTKPLPFATVFPRGMCRISNEDRIRVGSCLPAWRVQGHLEPVALCRSRYPFQKHMLCLAPKAENIERYGTRFDEVSQNASDEIPNNSANDTIISAPEKMDLPNISIM